MELCGGGDLLSYIKRRKKLTEETSCHLFKQVCEAVKYCHHKQVAHLDIKPDNLLLCEEGEIKLCDFGVSRNLTADMIKDQIGTPAYMAPEIHQRLPFVGWAADVWALGCLLFIML
jgi:serine/threonine protein kinase